MNTQEFIDSLVNDGLDNNTIIDFVRTQQAKTEKLLAALKDLADVARRCDSWEQFPPADLGRAELVIIEAEGAKPL
jgi:hypothetical protein